MHEVKGDNMRRSARLWGLGAALMVGAALMLLTTFASAAPRGAQHVRWDIVSTTGVPPGPFNPGGHASASAPNGGDTIPMTGSGTFVAPANGGGAGGGAGGRTWPASSRR